MNKRIYLDNASTSSPKAPGVAEAMRIFLEEVGCNIGRGSYEDAYAASDVVIDTRERLCRLFGFDRPSNVIFTANITQSLNTIIKGYLKPGDHVLVSSVEHNAMMRPLVQMEHRGVAVSRIPCDETGQLLLEGIEPLIRPETKAILMTHASNVCGTILPVEEVGEIAARRGLLFVVDAAQTAGAFDIDMAAMNIDVLCFTGHKSLLGPQGIGGFLIADAAAAKTEPLLSGGTGSISDSEEVPSFLPDRFEAGTLNLPGIYGLQASLRYLEATGIGSIRGRELALARRLHDGIAALPGARMIGTEDWTSRCPIVSVDFPALDNAEISFQLSDTHHILTRCGLHCAPHAHKTFGTFPQGTVRFSVSHANTEDEVDTAVRALDEILHTF